MGNGGNCIRLAFNFIYACQEIRFIFLVLSDGFVFYCFFFHFLVILCHVSRVRSGC